jgi:hypothetical protein
MLATLPYDKLFIQSLYPSVLDAGEKQEFTKIKGYKIHYTYLLICAVYVDRKINFCSSYIPSYFCHVSSAVGLIVYRTYSMERDPF